MRRGGAERGQASVELLAALPVLAALVLGAWQLVLLGESWWLAGVAARAAGRAELAGRDAGPAARAALPAGWAGRVVVGRDDEARLVVQVRVPALVARAGLGTVEARVGAGGAGG